MNADPRAGLPSASSFATDVQCPGRRQLLATLPNVIDLPDEETERGTRLHDAWLKQDPGELQDETEIEDYDAGLLHLKSLVDTWSEELLLFPKELPREERLWLYYPSLDPALSGQLDRAYRAGDYLLLPDFKSGFLTYVPRAVKSWQLRVYAVLAFRNYEDIQAVRVAFVKPKSKAEPIDYCDYSRTDLEESERAIFYHLWATKQPDAPRIAGPHCRYCPAMKAGICPEAGACSMLPSALSSNPTAVPDIQERVEALSVPDLLRIYQVKAVVTEILKAVTDRLKTFSDEQLAPLGLKHQERTVWDIVNVKAAFERLRSEKVPEDKLWALLSIGKTELTKELQRTFGWSADKAREWIKGQLGEFSETKTQDRLVGI